MNYQAVAAWVAEKIRSAGKPITLIRPGSTEGWTKVFDPSGRWKWVNDETAEETFTDPAAQEATYAGYALETGYHEGLIDGSIVRQGDRKLMCAGIPKPAPGERIRVGDAGGPVYHVVHCDPMSPGDTDLYYDVQVRV